jgi:hypothetical protein
MIIQDLKKGVPRCVYKESLKKNGMTVSVKFNREISDRVVQAKIEKALHPPVYGSRNLKKLSNRYNLALKCHTPRYLKLVRAGWNLLCNAVALKRAGLAGGRKGGWKMVGGKLVGEKLVGH